MSELSDVVRQKEVKFTPKGGGELTFVVKRPPISIEGAYSQWVEERAMATCEKAAGTPMYRTLCEIFMENCNNHAYDWGQEECSKTLAITKNGEISVGMRQFCRMVIAHFNPMLFTPERFDEMWDNFKTRVEIFRAVNEMYSATPQTAPPQQQQPEAAGQTA